MKNKHIIYNNNFVKVKKIKEHFYILKLFKKKKIELFLGKKKKINYKKTKLTNDEKLYLQDQKSDGHLHVVVDEKYNSNFKSLDKPLNLLLETYDVSDNNLIELSVDETQILVPFREITKVKYENFYYKKKFKKIDFNNEKNYKIVKNIKKEINCKNLNDLENYIYENGAIIENIKPLDLNSKFNN